MNQQGEIPAIGGINEKIEGFFDVCKIKGLTATPGVLIPHCNVEDLLLREEILDAVSVGKFHIWPVAKIGAGVEILTGAKPGKRHEDGTLEKTASSP